jgi:hypothetical protein
MFKKWIAEGLITAALYAWGILVHQFSEYTLTRAPIWREKARACWWQYKLKSLLTAEDCDDDKRADALGRLWKFETPPEGSHWAFKDGTYVPETGSGYMLDGHGDYIPTR